MNNYHLHTHRQTDEKQTSRNSISTRWWWWSSIWKKNQLEINKCISKKKSITFAGYQRIEWWWLSIYSSLRTAKLTLFPLAVNIRLWSNSFHQIYSSKTENASHSHFTPEASMCNLIQSLHKHLNMCKCEMCIDITVHIEIDRISVCKYRFPFLRMEKPKQYTYAFNDDIFVLCILLLQSLFLNIYALLNESE